MAERFLIDVVVSPRQAQAGISAVEGSLERLNRTAASTNSLLKGALQVAGLASGVVVVQRLIDKLVDLSDTYTQIQNQLSFVTKNTDELNSVTEQLIGVANRSRSSFESTAKLYSRTALAADQLGLSQGEILQVTETLNKAIILSGASAKEASNGLIQLSQAIASNRLGGDELRSVLEQLPVVADAISRSLGITRGQLRELGSQGVLTAKVITDALQLSAGRIEAAFAKTVPTIGQALQVAENDLINFVGQANKATGASQKLADTLIFLGANLSNIAFLAAAGIAAFGAAPLVKFAQGLAVAAANARLFAKFQSEAILISEASAVAVASEEVAVEAASLARIEAAAGQATADTFRAAATTRAAEAVAAAARVTLASVEADLAKLDVLLALTRAEIARVRASGAVAKANAAATRAEQALLALQSVRGETVRQLALAEGSLAEATFLAASAQQAEVGALGQAAGLQALSAVQAERAALAQRNLNTVLTGTPGLLSKISAGLRANAIGIAVVAVTALVVGLIGLKDLLNTVSSGIGIVGKAVASTTTFFRELAESVPVVGGAFNAVLKILLGVGAIVGAVFIGAASPVIALTLALAGLVTLLGTGKQVFDAFGGAARAAIVESKMIAPIGREILQVRKELEPLEQEFERLAKRRDEGLSFGGLRDVELIIERLRKRLVELGDAAKKQQGFGSAVTITSAFERRNELLREEIALLGKARFEREVGLLLLKEEENFSKVAKRPFTDTEKQTRRELIEAQVAGKDLAAVLDDIRDKRGPDQEFDRLKRLLDASGVSGEVYAATLAELQRQKVSSSPLAQGLKELRDIQLDLSKAPVLTELTFAGGTDPRAMLEQFQKLNREREIQAEITQRMQQVASGLTPEELSAAKLLIEEQIRSNAERVRRNQLDGQFLQQQSELADATILALIPDDFERSVRAAVQAQRDLKDATIQLSEAQIRQNLAAQETGAILQSLSEPTLLRTQQQAELNAEIQRQTDAMLAGTITAAQYGVVLQELEFRAAKLGTTFGDGLVVAFKEFQAATTEAAVAQTALTGAINAAADASAEFVRTGTVDFRQLAISLLADISRIITKLLILKAIEAASSAFGGSSGSTGGGNIGTAASDFTENFASGGRFPANEPFVVGERGPELLQFGQSGTITPNDQTVEAMAQAGSRGGSAPVVVPAPQVNVTVMNVTDPDDSVHSDAGERRILNVIERNPNRISRLS